MSAPLIIDEIFEDWPQPLAVQAAGRVVAWNAAARALQGGRSPGSRDPAALPPVLRTAPAVYAGEAVQLLFLAPPGTAPVLDPLDVAARLIGGLAHDLNNALMVIQTSAELLTQALDPQHPARSDASQVTAATRRAVELVRLMSGFARRHSGSASSVDLMTILRRHGRLIGRLLDREVIVEPDPDVAAAHVLVDQGALERIVARLALARATAEAPETRLALGARTAGPREGTPETIEVVLRRLPSAAGALAGVSPGPGASMGPELPTEALTLAAEAGLTLRADVAPDGSPAVVIGLPRDPTRTTTLASPAPPPVLPAPSPTGARQTILVVEDDAMALGTVAMLLRREGYEVLTTTSPASAMALFRARDTRVDLLITDVIMPTLDGDLLARQMLAVAPGLPVLYMSGYPADILKGRLAATPGARFLPKPFTPTMLLAQVRRLLDDALARR